MVIWPVTKIAVLSVALVSSISIMSCNDSSSVNAPQRAGLQGNWSVVLYADSIPYCSFSASIKIAAQYSAGAEITGTVTMSDVINKGQKFVLEGEASNYEGTLEEIEFSFSMTNDEKIYLEAEFGDSDLKSSGGGWMHVTANETTRGTSLSMTKK